LSFIAKWFLGSVDPISAGPGWRCDRIPDPQRAVVERAVVKGRAAVGLELGGGYDMSIRYMEFADVCGKLLSWLEDLSENSGKMEDSWTLQRIQVTWNLFENCLMPGIEWKTVAWIYFSDIQAKEQADGLTNNNLWWDLELVYGPIMFHLNPKSFTCMAWHSFCWGWASNGCRTSASFAWVHWVGKESLAQPIWDDSTDGLDTTEIY
jgi:hypothetical protein